MPERERKRAPFGSWKSPLSAKMVAASANVYSEISLGKDGSLFFLERRPAEAGRTVLLHSSHGSEVEDLTSMFNVRNRVHEYGGGSYVATDEAVFFSNFGDQIVYRLDLARKNSPRPITFEPNVFYADFTFDPEINRIICVREDHSSPGEPVNSITSLDPEGKEKPIILLSGNDFYSTPRKSPDGRKFSWLTWNHPHLPFFSTELHVADVSAGGNLVNDRLIAGGSEESIAEPRWSPDSVLYFVSDRTNWLNLYRLVGEKVEPIYETEAEFAGPHWVFGQASYAFVDGNRLVCRYFQDGTGHLALIDVSSGRLEEIPAPYTEMDYLVANEKSLIFRGGSSTSEARIVRFDLGSRVFENLYPKNDSNQFPAAYLSQPEPVEFPTSNGFSAYGLYYPPRNAEYVGPEGELPPLIVISHGGPTGAAQTDLDPEIQYWTSRGFAILDVNYGGSTGYGREYRTRLNGQWGVVDVEDCVNGALFLARQNKVNEKMLIIRGGSAGGYTTLCALTFSRAFRAGASYFGISDLEIFAGETHKFESRYLDLLLGPLPERRDLYRDRSPINHLDKIFSPIIFFQGLEDKIVPPNQAEMLFEALKKKGIPTAYVPFEEEQHGFRQAKNIARSLEAELYFYSRVFGFQPGDEIEPVKIQNLR